MNNPRFICKDICKSHQPTLSGIYNTASNTAEFEIQKDARRDEIDGINELGASI
jgi:hypothetical protein